MLVAVSALLAQAPTPSPIAAAAERGVWPEVLACAEAGAADMSAEGRARDRFSPPAIVRGDASGVMRGKGSQHVVANRPPAVDLLTSIAGLANVPWKDRVQFGEGASRSRPPFTAAYSTSRTAAAKRVTSARSFRTTRSTISALRRV